MAKNKIIYGGEVLIDLTADTVTPADLQEGVTAHDRSGALIIGTATGGGVDGDNIEYGLSVIGTAVIGSSVVS